MHREITKSVCRKASRTTSGSDSYFGVQQLFSSSDRYLLKPRAAALPPIDIEVLLLPSNSNTNNSNTNSIDTRDVSSSSGSVISSTVSCINYYGLYDMEEIDDASQVRMCVHLF